MSGNSFENICYAIKFTVTPPYILIKQNVKETSNKEKIWGEFYIPAKGRPKRLNSVTFGMKIYCPKNIFEDSDR